MDSNEKSLKERILSEMTIDQKSVLDSNFNKAKNIIGIREDETIEVRFKEKMTGPVQISMYLIGKLYAKEAGITEDEYVSNKELMDNLGIGEGSIYPWLKELRENKTIIQKKRDKISIHSIMKNRIEKILTEVNKKIGESSG